MSVNLRYAINKKKTKHLGPLFHTIDFDIRSDYTGSMVRDENEMAICGVFCIAGKEIKFKYPDLLRLERKIKDIVPRFSARVDPISEYVLEIGQGTWSLNKKETAYMHQTLISAINVLQKKIKLGM